MLKFLQRTTFGLIAGLSPMLANAQEEGAVEPSLLILDYSNSMWDDFGAGSRLQETRRILRSQLARNATTFSNLGLMAYGHREANNCSDIELIFEPGEASLPEVLAYAEGLTPTGQTPLTRAVQQGADVLGAQGTLIVMTDGTESCGLNPCLAANQIAEDSPGVRVHLIAIGMSEADAEGLSCLPDRTGGLLLHAENPVELEAAFATTRQIMVNEAATAELSEEVGNLTEETTQQDFRIAELEAQIETLRAQLATAEAIAAARSDQPIEGDPQIDNLLLQRVTDMEALIARLEAENGRLQASLANGEETNTALREQLDALGDELENARMLTLKLQEALATSQSETGDLAEAYEQLLAQVQALNTSVQAPDQCQVLEDQLATTQGLLDDQIAQNTAHEATIADLRSQLEGAATAGAVQQCERQIAAAMDEVDAIAAQMGVLLEERALLIAQNAELRAEAESEQERRINAFAAFGAQEEVLGEALAEVKRLQDEIAALTGELAQLQEAQDGDSLVIAAHEEEIAALEIELSETRDSHQQEVDALNVAQAELRDRLTAAETVADDYTANLSELEQINQSLQLTINQIQIDNADKDVQQAELMAENAELQTELNEAQRLAEGHRDRADQYELYLATLLDAQGEEEAPAEEVETPEVVQDAAQDLLALQHQLEQAQADKAALTDQIASLEGQVADQAAQITDLEAALAAEQDRCALIQTSFDEAQSQSSALLSQLEDTQSQLAQCQANLQALQDQVPERAGPDTVSVQLIDPAMTLVSYALVWEVEARDGTLKTSSTADTLELPAIPGRYTVRAVFGEQRVEDVFEVLPNETREHALRLSAGQLEVSFDEALPDTLRTAEAEVTLRRVGTGEELAGEAFVAGLSATLPLAPGTYEVEIAGPGPLYRARIDIAPSRTTELVVPWETALARIRFIDDQTGTSILAPVNWRIYRGQSLVLSGSGDVQLPLDDGEYRVEANVGGILAQSNFTLFGASEQEVLVPFADGQIDLSFLNVGQSITDQRFAWRLSSTLDGSLVATGSAADTQTVVPAGSYELEGRFGNQVRTTTIAVTAARQVPGRLAFAAGTIEARVAGVAADQDVLWSVERIVAGDVTERQTFSTTGNILTYDLDPGTYAITAQAGGQSQSARVTLVEGETTSLNLAL